MERYREVRARCRRVPLLHPSHLHMNVFELTRALVDVESITGNEERMGNVLFEQVSELASKFGGYAERIEVEPKRCNVFARWGNPVVTLSTHMDTVPPFFPSRE